MRLWQVCLSSFLAERTVKGYLIKNRKKSKEIKREVLLWQYLRANNRRAERTRDSQTTRQRRQRSLNARIATSLPKHIEYAKVVVSTTVQKSLLKKKKRITKFRLCTIIRRVEFNTRLFALLCKIEKLTKVKPFLFLTKSSDCAII